MIPDGVEVVHELNAEIVSERAQDDPRAESDGARLVER